MICNVRTNSNSPVDGGFDVITTSDVRQRNVCLDYDSDCTGSGSDASIPRNAVTALVSIRDYDSAGVLVGDATTTVPSAGALGKIKVSGINFYLTWIMMLFRSGLSIITDINTCAAWLQWRRHSRRE